MKFVLLISILVLMPMVTVADEVVSATSEDIEKVDQDLGDSAKATMPAQKPGVSRPSAITKDNFGAIVMKEAKDAKDVRAAQDKNFGQWVSEQRRQDGKNRPDTAGDMRDQAAGHTHSAADNGQGSSGSNPGNGHH